jgi:hypothetical protein
VVGEDPAESRVDQQRVALGGGYGRRIRTDLEIELVTTARHDGPPGAERETEMDPPRTYL